MIKTDELSSPASCLNKARDDERLFVLLARDVAAPVAIRAWIGERLRRGKNLINDPQIIEAEMCAAAMEREAQSVSGKARPTFKHPKVCVLNHGKHFCDCELSDESVE